MKKKPTSKSKKVKKFKAWGVYGENATYGIIWRGIFDRNPSPFAIYERKEEANRHAENITWGCSKYKVVPITITINTK